MRGNFWRACFKDRWIRESFDFYCRRMRCPVDREAIKSFCNGAYLSLVNRFRHFTSY